MAVAGDLKSDLNSYLHASSNSAGASHNLLRLLAPICESCALRYDLTEQAMQNFAIITPEDRDRLLAHLRQRRRLIRQKHLLFNCFLILLLAAVPSFLAVNLLQFPHHSYMLTWLVVGLLAAWSALLFMLHLWAEAGSGPRLTRFRAALPDDLLGRGLLADCLQRPDPRDLLDPRLLDPEHTQLDDIPSLPTDAIGRIDFLMGHYRDLGWSRMQARLAALQDGNPGPSSPVPDKWPFYYLSYGECITLIDFLIDILEGRVDNDGETGDG
jgi:hypothetical protein